MTAAISTAARGEAADRATCEDISQADIWSVPFLLVTASSTVPQKQLPTYVMGVPSGLSEEGPQSRRNRSMRHQQNKPRRASSDQMMRSTRNESATCAASIAEVAEYDADEFN
jgi:hypothetical protein